MRSSRLCARVGAVNAVPPGDALGTPPCADPMSAIPLAREGAGAAGRTGACDHKPQRRSIQVSCLGPALPSSFAKVRLLMGEPSVAGVCRASVVGVRLRLMFSLALGDTLCST